MTSGLDKGCDQSHKCFQRYLINSYSTLHKPSQEFPSQRKIRSTYGQTDFSSKVDWLWQLSNHRVLSIMFGGTLWNLVIEFCLILSRGILLWALYGITSEPLVLPGRFEHKKDSKASQGLNSKSGFFNVQVLIKVSWGEICISCSQFLDPLTTVSCFMSRFWPTYKLIYKSK